MSKSSQVVTVRHTVDAPIETTFAAWTTPEQVRRWWKQTPAGRCTECEIDLRMGGGYRIVLEDPAQDGPCVVTGEFLVVEAPRRLVYSWTAETSLGRVEESVVEVEFKAVGPEATEVIVRHRGLPETPVSEAHREGWQAILASLAERLQPDLRPGADDTGLLDQALQRIDIADAVYVRSEFNAPWGVRMEADGLTFFHLVLQGRAWVQVDGHDDCPLQSGDLVVLPHGTAHELRDQPETPCRSLEELFEAGAIDETLTLRCGGGGPLTRMVCGVFAFADRRTEPLLTGLPPVLQVAGDGGNVAPWLSEILDRVSEEIVAGRPGSRAVVLRLTDVLFIRTVRRALEGTLAQSQGWLRALEDPQIAAAIAEVHRDPAAAWSVKSLAAVAGMSRSGFAARFTELVGSSPARYVSDWRLARAAGWLRSTSESVGEIAARAGYQSEASFSRAFKRHMGLSPGRYRRRPVPTADFLRL